MQSLDEKFLKKIKKSLYGKTQVVQAIFPAGFGQVALQETNDILKTLWFPNKVISECVLADQIIRIDPIHLFAATELLMRSTTLSDVRLVLYEGKAFGKNAFEKRCQDVSWEFFLNQTMSVKIQVDSVASEAFHETGLKKILSDVIQSHVAEVVGGENTHDTTIYASLYKNKLTLSISLAGNPLYKRGYRGELSASAPLREDAAACCLLSAMQFAKKQNAEFSPEMLLVPFSGTGTFAFEYLQQICQLSPALFGRGYALQKMPLFRLEHFNYLFKKAREHVLLNAQKNVQMIGMDIAEKANAACLDNMTSFKKQLQQQGVLFSADLLMTILQHDFLEKELPENIALDKNIFIPMNPPYGIRLGNTASSFAMYQRIAEKINEISAQAKQAKKHVLGFILCPNEPTWLAFSKQLKQAKTETYHFTQGGLDIRVCQFFIE